MEYTVKRSKRKTVSIEITGERRVLVRAPLYMSSGEIDGFVRRYGGWIDKKLAEAGKRAEFAESVRLREPELRKAAQTVIPPLVERHSELMGLKPSSVRITSAEKRFGSCSGKNGISFSWRLMAYPPPAVEYVVVHELAHIKHHNHGREFYALIEKYMPDWKERRKMLRTVC